MQRMSRTPSVLRFLTQTLLGKQEQEQLSGIGFLDEGHGYDIFGLHPDWVKGMVAALQPLYKHWFRVTGHGTENIPARGPAILASNHSGMIPLDGTMIYSDVVLHTSPARVPRAVTDHFVPRLPVISTLYARCGTVGGSRGNVHALLERGELLLIFPEGVPGIDKDFRDRYQLRPFRVGVAEMSIRHRAPVIPVAVIGAEEQFPIRLRLPLHTFGAPYVPISPIPFPLPVHYHIHYGQPLHLYDGLSASDADDPVITAAAAARVQESVQALIEAGLKSRLGVFI
jgi:1-acyl-sn-glycerol-3-phosphate acyltransferase